MLPDFCTCIQLFVYSRPVFFPGPENPTFVCSSPTPLPQNKRVDLFWSLFLLVFPPARVLDEVAIFDPWCGRSRIASSNLKEVLTRCNLSGIMLHE
jgi:hypothetical protein